MDRLISGNSNCNLVIPIRAIAILRSEWLFHATRIGIGETVNNSRRRVFKRDYPGKPQRSGGVWRERWRRGEVLPREPNGGLALEA